MRFQEGRKVVDVEMKRLLQEGFDLRNEIEHLRAGKVARASARKNLHPEFSVRHGAPAHAL